MSSIDFFLILIIFLFFDKSNAICDCRLGTNRRIINGVDAPQDYLPWFAIVAISSQNSLSASCGAFILNDQYVVTAAHCTQGVASSYQVIFNINSLTNLQTNPKRAVDQIYIHPNYNSRKLGLGHDISLLRLKDKVPFVQNKVEQACIKFLNNRMNNILVAGIGSITRFEIKNGQRTRATYPTKLKYTTLQETTQRTKRLIFARGKRKNDNICTGDSGSPAHTYVNGKVAVVGVASFGVEQKTSRRNVVVMCQGLAGFARLSYEKPFLDRYASGNYCTI